MIRFNILIISRIVKIFFALWFTIKLLEDIRYQCTSFSTISPGILNVYSLFPTYSLIFALTPVSSLPHVRQFLHEFLPVQLFLLEEPILHTYSENFCIKVIFYFLYNHTATTDRLFHRLSSCFVVC